MFILYRVGNVSFNLKSWQKIILNWKTFFRGRNKIGLLVRFVGQVVLHFLIFINRFDNFGLRCAFHSMKLGPVKYMYIYLKTIIDRLRGQSNKYLASPPDGVTIAREMYYRVVILVDGYWGNFSQIELVVLIWLRVESDVSAEFRKIEKEQFDSCVWGEIAQRNQRALGCCVRWLFSFDGDRQKLV